MNQMKEIVTTAQRVLDALGAPVTVVGSINADLTVETERLPGPGETVIGGSLVLDNGESTRIPIFPVDTVDTTGAGDSFMGTLLSALAAGCSLADGACLAAAVSSLATTKVGAQASYRGAAAVRSFLESQEL